MKQFYEHIRVDAETLRFYAMCLICGKKQYGAKIPLICRGGENSCQVRWRCGKQAKSNGLQPRKGKCNAAACHKVQSVPILLSACM